MDRTDRIDGGTSVCELWRGSDGRIRMAEHFQWSSREGSGTNQYEEIETEPAS